MSEGDYNHTNVTPSEYPGECSITEGELREVYEAFVDEDSPVGEYVDDWPPEDRAGNVYPIWFTLGELNSRGKLLDDNDTPFDPFAGNREPVSGDSWAYCNAPLDKWRKRYPEIRYCGQVTPPDDTYCSNHDNRKHIMKSAEEHMQTGLFAKSLDHVYAKLNPWQKLVGWGTFESLMGESSYEFGVEYEAKEFDFSEEVIVPDETGEDGILEAKCGYPTDYVDPALSLYVAAMMGVQMLTVQPRVMYENREEGEGMMEAKTVSHADLTPPPNEHDPSPQEYKTLEEWTEHHLNLPLSRLVTDRPKLLERGGVSVDAEDSDDGVGGDDIVLEIDANADGIETKEGGTDPNAFEDNDYQSPSEEIVESASDE